MSSGTTNVGTPSFRAPEVGNGPYTGEADMFSFGKTIDCVRNDRTAFADEIYKMTLFACAVKEVFALNFCAVRIPNNALMR